MSQDSNLLFNIDIFLLCVAALFALLALPKAVARLSHLSEWSEGHIFRSIEIRGPGRDVHPSQTYDRKVAPFSPNSASPIHIELGNAEKAAHGSDDIHMHSSHADLVRNYSTSSGSVRTRHSNLPTHMPAWSSMLPRLSSLLEVTVRPGYTLSKLLLLLAYLIVMLYAGLVNSDPFTDPGRAGFVATSQIPVIIVFATKNNVLGVLVGQGYQKLNYLHRFAGRLFILAVNVHAIGYFYSWSIDGTFRKHLQPSIIWGFVGLVAVDLLFLLSLSVFRQMFFHAFYATHIITAGVILVATCMHEPVTVPYVATALALYGVDRLLRLIKTRYTTARLRPLSELNMTRIEVPQLNAGWRAGQHLRIKVLSRGMGWLGWCESHPFTIASVSKDPGAEGLVLMCKKAGDWTGKLFELAKRAEYGEAGGVGRDVKVLIEGPYGGPGHSIPSSFSGVMIVAGGSGITYALSTVQELMKKDAQRSSRVKIVEFVWSVPNPSNLVPLLPLFSSLLAQSHSSYMSLRISVFYTRAPTSGDVFKPFRTLPSGLTLSPSRPRLSKILEAVVDRTCALYSEGGRRPHRGPLTGVLIGVCGPLALAEDARKAVRTFRQDRRKRVGGIELHEEVFGC
ncbi:hypothetical protein AcW1_010148 [Taiwanofungus camphoratus]|nr:hypothetical protein AcW1_010148 [Antrodia cinnamomea]